MRASTALLALGCVAAAVAEDVVVEDAPVESSATSSAKLAAFTPTSLKAPFLEQFVDGWDARWKPSHAKKENTEEEWQYVGTWKAEEPVELTGLTGDNGLVLKDKAAHHAISAKFDKPIDNAGKTLVVQYEVKLQNSLECGGAYMKLLQDGAALASDEFSNASPYIIMFGPDKCGSTNKVHFIFRHKNPVSGVYEEKHLEAPPAAVIDRLVNLYTLIVRPDQTFEILINGESSKKGSLLENFLPAVIPPKEIDDENDSKPADWVDAEKMPDPDAVKPEDWDEDAPYEIVDESAEKPADWLEDEPTTIPDPEATKPEDWDDEEDGDWIAPQVANPKCDDAAGCGKWEKPMIKNPAYKGKWMRPWIENPEYKGLWAPRKIANPNYFETSTPADFEPIGGIGFELWTMNEDILFDNIYIGHSVEDAQALQKETFDVKKASEEKAAADWKKAQDKLKPKSPSDLVFLDDPVLYIKEKTQLFVTLAQKNPVDAVKFVPEVAGAIGVGLITILVLLAGAVGGGAAAAAKNAPSKEEIQKKADEAKKAATKAKDDAVAAVSSGAEKVQSEVNKRTGKSS